MPGARAVPGKASMAGYDDESQAGGVTRSRGPRSSLMLAERAILAAFADADVRTRRPLVQSTGLSRAGGDGEGQRRGHPLPAGPRKLLKPVPPQADWLACDPRPAIAGLLRCQVIMVNDANLAALGEAHFGAAKTHRGVVHLSVRDGIGAG